MFEHQKQTSPKPRLWVALGIKLYQLTQESNNFQNPGLCLALANSKPEDCVTNTNLMTPTHLVLLIFQALWQPSRLHNSAKISTWVEEISGLTYEERKRYWSYFSSLHAGPNPLWTESISKGRHPNGFKLTLVLGIFALLYRMLCLPIKALLFNVFIWTENILS